MATVLLNGTSKLEMIVDDEDIERVTELKWYPLFCKGGPYIKRQWLDKGIYRRQYLHQFILGGNHQPIDHINHNGLDNRKCNLRFATRKQNAWNIRISSRNKSGIKGVYFEASSQKWTVQVRLGSRVRRTIGRFNSITEAASARDRVVKELHGEFYCAG